MLRGAAIIKSFILSTAIFIFFCCIPLHIYADNTYYLCPANTRTVYGQYYYYSQRYFAITPTLDVRGVQFNQGSANQYHFYLISSVRFSGSVESGTSTTNNLNPSSIEVDGVTYYYVMNGTPNNQNSPVYNTFPTVENIDGLTEVQSAIYYTYGVGYTPPPTYGSLIDLGYYTNFTNSTQSNISQMRHNKDTISWNGYNDSNGNQINTIDCQVEIQAFSTEYQASTKSDLLNKTIVDVVNWGSPTTIYEGSANRGLFEIEWGDVADYLNGSSVTDSFWTQLWPHLNENMWYSKGWNYRIRLKTSDDSFIGEWQTIYTMTSAPPKDAETVYNYYYYYGGQGITDDVVDVLNNINTTNNTQNIWYINNNPVDPSGGSSDWLEILLKFISDQIGKIIDLFSNMFNSVLDFLLGLLQGFDPVGTFINWWNQLKLKFESIDLTLPIFNIPDDEDLSGFGVLVQKTIEIYTTNGLGYMIFIPLLLLILRMIL